MVKKSESVKSKYNSSENKAEGCSIKVFNCQSTSLLKATTPIHAWDFRHYFWEIKSTEYKGVITLLQRLVELFKRKVTYFLTPGKFHILGEKRRTPVKTLDLKPGEIVEVRSKEEIMKTLDLRGRNRGLEFMPEMLKYCGKRFKVFRKVDRMIFDATGRMRLIPNTVILKGVNCDGSAHGGCQRTCFCLWREIWLKRVEKADEFC